MSSFYSGFNKAATPAYHYEYWAHYADAKRRCDELTATGVRLLSDFVQPRYAYGCPFERGFTREQLIEYPGSVWAVEWQVKTEVVV